MPLEYKKTILFKKTIVLGVFFLSFLIFFASSGEKAKAENYVCQRNFAGAGGRNVFTRYDAATTQNQCEAENGKTSFQYSWVTESEFNKNQSADWASTKAENFPDDDQAFCNILGGGSIAKCLLSPVFWLVKILLLVAVSLFAWIIDVKNIQYILNGQGIIYKTWTTVRDILNLAFILVLLYSAFCTIFQIGKYNYKKILLTLVIMALLVNFSFPITRVIIDASNVMMYSIIKTQLTDQGNAFLTITRNSHLSSIINTNYPTAGAMLTSIVFIFMLAITLLAIALLLVVRTVALAIIVIFSPLGFVGNIMPGFESYAGKWWENLFKYSFFGPIMMLGLSIAMSIMSAMDNIDKTIVPITGTAAKISGAAIQPNLIGSIAFFSIPIVILWMVMGLAQSMGIEGASTIMGGAQKAMKWAGKNLTPYNTAKFLAGAGVSRVERGLAKGKYTKFLVPRVYKEAYKQRTAMKDREAFEGSTGEMHDLFNKVLSRGKEITDNAHAAHEGKVAKYAKEISDVDTNADYVIKELEAAIKNKNVAKAEGALKVLGKENNWNDMMHAIGDKYGDGVKIASPIHFKNAMRDMLTQARGGSKDAWKENDLDDFLAKQMMGLSGVAIGAGNVGSAGMSKFNKETGKFENNSIKGQADVARAKFQNLEPQQRQRTTHHNSVLGEDENGNIAEIDEVQQAILGVYDEGDVDQMGRNRADMRRQVKKAQTGLNEKGEVAISPAVKTIFTKLIDSNPNLREYAKTIGEGKVKIDAKKEKKEEPREERRRKPGEDGGVNDKYKKTEGGLWTPKF